MKNAYQDTDAVHIKTIISRSGPWYQNNKKKKYLKIQEPKPQFYRAKTPNPSQS